MSTELQRLYLSEEENEFFVRMGNKLQRVLMDDLKESGLRFGADQIGCFFINLAVSAIRQKGPQKDDVIQWAAMTADIAFQLLQENDERLAKAAAKH